MARSLAGYSLLLALFAWTVIAQADPPSAVPAARAKKPKSAPAASPAAPPSKTPAARSATTGADLSVADLAALARESTVVISIAGRDSERYALGSGFVIARDGLIATNLHVIGEARPISVVTADARRLKVTSIHATDRARDLAIIRVDATDLKPLELGDSDALKQGQEVVVMGNPRGYEHSIVSGVVSAIRVIDDRPLIQLAIPIEQGNSGGPVLDRRGRVQGIVTLKQAATENLGFAVAINALKPLLAKPNPVPIEHWLTIGALNTNDWTPLFGARWRQRAGRIVVDGPGAGFGGRTILVSNRPVPAVPFEMAVWVRLGREDGAAGLAFHLHETNRHYGFYPSNGRLRFTRFDGPDVYSWHVLNEVRSAAYRRGEWNRLKVRVEEGRILAFVNDVLVVESNDAEFRAGSIGLASFRDTHAEFKGFEVGKAVPSLLPPGAVVDRAERVAAGIKNDGPPDAKSIDKLLPDGDAGIRALRQSAQRREREAAQLRRLADALHARRVQLELAAAFAKKEDKDIDLLRASLLIARLDNEDLDVDAYVREVDRITASIRADLPPKPSPATTLARIDEHLFKELGFHGSRTDYYNRSNSYLNEVIDDREGLPITLSILYIELARRLGVTVAGVGLPGHFMVRFDPPGGTETFIDVFEEGHRLTRRDVEDRWKTLLDRPLTADDWRSDTKRQIVRRLVQNLEANAEEANDAERFLRYVDALLAVDPAAPQEHWKRALLCYQTGRRTEALAETAWLLAQDPAKMSDVADPSQIRQLKSLLESNP